jgi:hypothetical protein
MTEELTEKEKESIKKRLNRYCSKWAFDRLEDTYKLINDIRTGKKKKTDWFIAGMISNEDILGELLLANYIA